MSTTTTHLAWVDHARGIGIIAVVIGHVIRGLDSTNRIDVPSSALLADSIIYTWHMPLFFLLSGLFLEGSRLRRGSDGLIRSKVATLVWPYVIWSLLQGSVQVAFGGATNTDLSAGDVLALWDPILHFWFLYALFFVFVLVTAARSAGASPLLILIGTGALYLVADHVQFPIPLRLVSENAVFFALGMVIATPHTRSLARRLPSTSTVRVALFAGCALGLVVLEWFFHRSGEPRLEEHSLLAAFVAVVGVGVAVQLAMLGDRLGTRWLAKLGTHSMTIYLAHILFASTLRVILLKLSITSFSGHLVAGVGIGLLGPIVLDVFAKRMNATWLFSAPARVIS
jgi:fucose 4-O-acetylase-like acetyltransferase